MSMRNDWDAKEISSAIFSNSWDITRSPVVFVLQSSSSSIDSLAVVLIPLKEISFIRIRSFKAQEDEAVIINSNLNLFGPCWQERVWNQLAVRWRNESLCRCSGIWPALVWAFTASEGTEDIPTPAQFTADTRIRYVWPEPRPDTWSCKTNSLTTQPRS